MSKKSKMKKERKQEKKRANASSAGRGALWRPLEELSFDDGEGGDVIVINGDGTAATAEEARNEYFAEVAEAIRGNRPQALPSMARWGELMGFSIYDVKIPVFKHGVVGQVMEPIFAAVFLLDYVECFRWLAERLFNGQARKSATAQASLDLVVRGTLVTGAQFADGSPKARMTEILVRLLIEAIHHENSVLESEPHVAFAGNPIFQRELSRFRGELHAERERQELVDTTMADAPVDDGSSETIGVRMVAEQSFALRI